MKLINKINSKIDLLLNQQFPLENEFQYCEMISKKLQSKEGVESFSDADILFFLLNIDKNCTYEDLEQIFKPIFDFFDEYDVEDEFTDLLDVTWVLRHQIDSKAFLSYIKGFDIKKFIFKDVDNDAALDSKIILIKRLTDFKLLSKFIIKDNFLIGKFVELFYSYTEHLGNDFSNFARYKINYELVKDIKSKVSKRSIYQKEGLMAMPDGSFVGVADFLEEVDISHLTKRFSDKHFNLSKQLDSFRNNNNKQLKVYKKALEILKQINEDNESIIDFDYNIVSKLDDDIALELIQMILEHNRRIFNELEIKNIQNTNYNIIESLFVQCNISLEDLPASEKDILFKNVQIEKLKQILPLLNSPNWSWLNCKHPNFVQVILNTSEEILKFLDNCLKSQIIDKSFIKQNIGVLIDKNKISVNEKDVVAMFLLFKNNVDLLNRSVWPLDRRVLKNLSLLLMPTKLLKETLNLAKNYQLDLKGENAKMYSLDILNCFENFDSLDSFIELGFADYARQNVNILRNGSDKIVTRLSIYCNIGLNPMAKEDRLLGSITNGKNFYVADDDLENYKLLRVNEYLENENFVILSSSKRLTISKDTGQLEIVRKLDEAFKVSELEYQINDCIISRIKFLRNLECLLKVKPIDIEVLFAALTYNSVLESDTLDFIKDCLVNILQGKRLKFN